MCRTGSERGAYTAFLGLRVEAPAATVCCCVLRCLHTSKAACSMWPGHVRMGHAAPVVHRGCHDDAAGQPRRRAGMPPVHACCSDTCGIRQPKHVGGHYTQPQKASAIEAYSTLLQKQVEGGQRTDHLILMAYGCQVWHSRQASSHRACACVWLCVHTHTHACASGNTSLRMESNGSVWRIKSWAPSIRCNTHRGANQQFQRAAVGRESCVASPPSLLAWG